MKKERINYRKLCKAQDAKIDALEKQNDELEKRVAALEKNRGFGAVKNFFNNAVGKMLGAVKGFGLDVKDKAIIAKDGAEMVIARVEVKQLNNLLKSETKKVGRLSQYANGYEMMLKGHEQQLAGCIANKGFWSYVCHPILQSQIHNEKETLPRFKKQVSDLNLKVANINGKRNNQQVRLNNATKHRDETIKRYNERHELGMD